MSGTKVTMAEIAAKAGEQTARAIFQRNGNPESLSVTEIGLSTCVSLAVRLVLEEVERIETEAHAKRIAEIRADMEAEIRRATQQPYVPNGKAP